jgi:MFS transporter, FLVCR family, MFS-domain-containing protein 7
MVGRQTFVYLLVVASSQVGWNDAFSFTSSTMKVPHALQEHRSSKPSYRLHSLVPVKDRAVISLGMTDGANDNDEATNGEAANNDAAAVAMRRMNSVEPQVFPQRWVQLAYLSLLALLSDWICFSVAATPETYEAAFQHSAASLIDMFLFCNVASCFLVTDIVAKVGLQKAVQGAAVLMMVGCWLRSGISFLPMIPGAEHLMSYPFVVFGTLLVGFAQPFFQCTPPLLSAQWFAASERATSTAVALNFNQIGIATAFLVGGTMATSRAGLENYFGLIAVLCTAAAAGTLLQFKNEPPIPPSASEMEKKIQNHQEPPFLESAQRFFKTPGFTNALAAFVCSISITNIVGAFIDDVMERGGIVDQFQIDLAGAGFELAILLGGIVVGGYVDRTKEYKRVTQICLGLTSLLVIPLGLTEHAIGKEPLLLLISLLGLGIAAGPVQPINAELAVDVVYPGDETAVESVQQIGGNLVSALLVPVAELAAKRDYQLLPSVTWAASDIRGDVVLLMTIALATISYFSFFDAPLRRSKADETEDDSAQGPALNTATDSCAVNLSLEAKGTDNESNEVLLS